MDNNNIPQEYKPLGAWAYVGYKILFSIPLVGLILLIVFAFSNDNINRRNYARSFFCAWLIIAIIAIIVFVILLVAGVSFGALANSASTTY